VGVPPEGALLPGDGEAVGVGLARADGALRHVLGPVRPPRPHLPDAVPVHRHVVAAAVDDPDHERVALAHLHRRPRELPVHRHDAVLPAQPSHRRLLDLQPQACISFRSYPSYMLKTVSPMIYTGNYHELMVLLLGNYCLLQQRAEEKSSNQGHQDACLHLSSASALLGSNRLCRGVSLYIGVGVGAGGGGAEQKAGGTGIQRSHYKEKEDPLHPS